MGVGDDLTVEGKTFSLIETFKDNTGTGVVPDILILSHDDVKRFMGGDIEATYVLVKTAAGTNNLGLATQIKGFDEGLRVELAEENPYLTANLSSLSIFIYVLSFFVLIVTSLLIISNFETFLYKYKQQFAIMRSIGATARQLFGIILVQSSVITATGAFIGVGLAYISQHYVQGFLQDWMGISVARGTSIWVWHCG
ncbi:ABC transporter permease [Rossellomorea sp. H39__3]